MQFLRPLARSLATACLFLAGTSCTGQDVAAQDRTGPPVCSAASVSRNLSELIAVSHLIVVATPQVPVEALTRAAASSSPGYVNIPLTAVHVLKGDPPAGDLVLKVYPRDGPYAPPMAALIAASNAPQLFFLVQVDDSPGGLYFPGHTAQALQASTPAATDVVRGEVERQRRVLATWRPDPALPHYAEVERLIEQLASFHRTGERGTPSEREAQQEIFRRLQELGRSAVPAIIAHMDDRRPLAFPQMHLANYTPDAFEAQRHYGPKLIVDALEAILNQMTGRSFGAIYNGGSERERRVAVDGWRIYAANLRCTWTGG